MKSRNILLLSLLVTTSMFLSLQSCEGIFDNEDPEVKEDTLYVKFVNDAASQYTIKSLELRPRGPVGSAQTPTENWSQNILASGVSIAPGAHVFFTLNIPSGHWHEYRLYVDDGNGNTVAIHNQNGFSGASDLPITHWGADTRTVGITIVYDNYVQKIIVSGYSDFAGID